MVMVFVMQVGDLQWSNVHCSMNEETNEVRVVDGDGQRRATLVGDGDGAVSVFVDGNRFLVRENCTEDAYASIASNAGEHGMSAPMPGKLIQVHVSKHDVVKKGDALLVLEAMKMEVKKTTSNAITIAIAITFTIIITSESVFFHDHHRHRHTAIIFTLKMIVCVCVCVSACDSCQP